MLPVDYASDLLTNVICAIGARYLPSRREASDELYEYLFLQLKNFPINPEQREVQAVLLTSYSGIYAGASSWFKESVRLHLRMVEFARETSIFQYNPHDDCDKDWESFIPAETLKRVSYGLYLVDGQMAILFNYPPALSHYEIKHILPCSDQLWEANTADEWLALLHTLPLKDGPHFFEGLQEVLIFGRFSSQISSFGGLMILLAIHIMIRNMAQYAGLLETSPVQAPDVFSRRSQLGTALNGLRALLPKRTKGPFQDMWNLFTVTWNMAYIHLHLPDTIITSGVVEVSLDETIATASALARPQSRPPPGTALLSNDFKNIPYQMLSFTTSHVFFFLQNFDDQTMETCPMITFMFYKATLVAWQILNASKDFNVDKKEEDDSKNVTERSYMMQRLADDMLSCIHLESYDLVGTFEKWVENVLLSKTSWGVGKCGAASFSSMIHDRSL